MIEGTAELQVVDEDGGVVLRNWGATREELLWVVEDHNRRVDREEIEAMRTSSQV